MEPQAESRYERFAKVCREAAARGSLSPEHLARLAEESAPEVLAGVIANPFAPIELAEHLVQRADATIAKLALEEESLPLGVALKFAEHRSWYVRAAAAQFRGAPAELLHLLALDPDEDVRLAVAGNPTASAVLLVDLAHDPCDEVRHAVVRNVSTPMKAIRHLADDEDLTIRRWIALNRKLPADLFEKLRRDEHDAVRCSLAANRNLTDSQLQRLSRDASDRVRSAVAHRLADAELLTNLSRDRALSVRLAVFQNGKAPADIRDKLEIELGTREKQIAAFKKEIFRDLWGSDADVPDDQD